MNIVSVPDGFALQPVNIGTVENLIALISDIRASYLQQIVEKFCTISLDNSFKLTIIISKTDGFQ